MISTWSLIPSTWPLSQYFFLISLISSSKTSYTWYAVFELTYRKGISCFFANSTPSSVCTLLSSERSNLVATRTLLTLLGALFSICVIHLSMFLKDSASVMEYVRIMPAAPLQQVWVMFLKRSCPAVSQICILNFLSSTTKDFTLKSTPMVAVQLSLKLFSQNLVIRLVFPTPLSPMIITFTL